MYLGCRRNSIVIVVLIITVVLLLFKYKYHHNATVHGRFLALESNGGQVGNQLFHLCSGYAIAKKLNRRHYIRTLEADGFHIGRHLQKIEGIFPRLRNTFVVMEVGNEHREPFALTKDGKVGCCEYEDPTRLQNNTKQFLVLGLHYAQNVRYFEPILSEIRYLMEFSDEVIREGNEILRRWRIALAVTTTFARKPMLHLLQHAYELPARNGHNAHTSIVDGQKLLETQDFIELKLATDLEDTVRKLRHIAAITKLKDFLIFGDDADFMRRMAERLRPNKARFSTFSEGVDFYLASKMCSAMFISATTSTFGWWLAFFAPNQNAIFYNNDMSSHADRTPNKDLFLSSWKMYSDN